MKPKYLPMIMMLSLSLMCSNLFAKGHLDQYFLIKDHWGSKDVITAYKKLACTVTKRGGAANFTIQQKVFGGWKDRGRTIKLNYGKNAKTHTINVTPGAKYRVFINAPTFFPSEGLVFCKGSK